MSTLYWAVPVHLDALFLEADQAGPGPMADFSLQPWSDGTRDYNSSNPFTSEEVLEKPFQDSGFTLRPACIFTGRCPTASRAFSPTPTG
jgi:hypothetical protein